MIFAEGYKQLNSAQKQAVDTIDGLVLVVAGPGTGKTQLLALSPPIYCKKQMLRHKIFCV
ncbi:MAG: UvrD-helicase domain-containing protein [Candidatus Saccharimonadales bacterium]